MLLTNPEVTLAMVTVVIDPLIFTKFPALRLVGFSAAGLDRVAASLTTEDVQAAWKWTAAALVGRGPAATGTAAIPEVPRWRGTVRVAGLCSAIGARHFAPLRGWDVDALPGDTLTVRFARPRTDWFVPLDERPTDVPATAATVVFAAGHAVLGWSFNARQSRDTCLNTDTTCALFFSEATNRQQAKASLDAIQELRQQLVWRGAEAGAAVVLDASTPHLEL